ncbi:MAG: DUF4258 domain-containing protein [Calditrichia bacterium]
MTDIAITRHAAKRMQQRRIDEKIISLALVYGRKIYARDSLYVFLGKRSLQKLGRLAEELNGTTLVLNPKTKELITCFRNPQFLKKIRYKK